MNNKTKEKVLIYAKLSQDLKQLNKFVGKDTNELIIASAILTLARKNAIDKDIAKRLLKDTKMIDLIDIPFNSKHIVNYNMIK